MLSTRGTKLIYVMTADIATSPSSLSAASETQCSSTVPCTNFQLDSHLQDSRVSCTEYELHSEQWINKLLGMYMCLSSESLCIYIYIYYSWFPVPSWRRIVWRQCMKINTYHVLVCIVILPMLFASHGFERASSTTIGDPNADVRAKLYRKSSF